MGDLQEKFRFQLKRELCRQVGTCITCFHRPAESGRVRCAECAAYHAGFLRRQRAARIDAGLCTKCGRRDAAPAKLMCETCAEKNAASSKARRERLFATAHRPGKS